MDVKKITACGESGFPARFLGAGRPISGRRAIPVWIDALGESWSPVTWVILNNRHESKRYHPSAAPVQYRTLSCLRHGRGTGKRKLHRHGNDAAVAGVNAVAQRKTLSMESVAGHGAAFDEFPVPTALKGLNRG